jgi:hypothetical protein
MPMPAELRALIERFNRVGCLLDGVDEDAIRDGDAAVKLRQLGDIVMDNVDRSLNCRTRFR